LFDVQSLSIPRAVAYSDDCTVLGAPFLITQYVTGDAPIPWSGEGTSQDEKERLTIANDFVDALAAIHTFDWSRSALTALSGNIPPPDIARNQTNRWAEHAGLAEGLPLQMHYGMRWLEAHAPRAEHVTVVHGDYRAGNFLQHKGRITAILDWELVHLGDPHEDLAWAGLRVFSPGKTRIGGLIERKAFYERYCMRTGFSVRPEVLRYYEVFGMFKIVATLVGAIRRVESGAHDVRMAAMGLQLAPRLFELNRLIKEAK
jgi:aminoglycoside phosphotransferase (APT) family kinase protein